MKRVILGTAGHIDHGKTSFIKALTGIDCDRLKEEKERGITIELGYAYLYLPSGTKVGIVDVPGHEKFVSKMVAGAAGIDIVALIIAADEGVMPQTREHLYICELLRVKYGIVVLTKVDLVDNELIELQKEDIRDFLKGTFLEKAPIVEVSSVTGKGIEEFKTILDNLCKNISDRPLETPFRMPVDDVISIKGFGTVVRGTAISGRIKTGEEVLLLPDNIKGRVRGIQSHGQFVEEGYAGERLAINIPDYERGELRRGMLVVRDGYHHLTSHILVNFYYLPYNEKPLKQRIVCQFHAMTMKTTAEVFFIGVDKVFPGTKVNALVRLEQPYAFSYGDPYVIRGFGIYTTMGGGIILHPCLKNINKSLITENYLKPFLEGDYSGILSTILGEQGGAGLNIKDIMGFLNLELSKVENLLKTLIEEGKIIEDGKNKRFFDRTYYENLKVQTLTTIKKFHTENPLKPGIKKEELFVKIGSFGELFQLIIKELLDNGSIVVEGDIVRIAEFKPGGEDSIFKPLEEGLKKMGLQTEEPNKLSEMLKIDEKKIRDMLTTLVKRGSVIRVKENYYIHKEVFDEFKNRVLDFFSKKDILTPQDVREMFNISRKYMIPLLEYLDSIKLTIRVQEGRRLRK